MKEIIKCVSRDSDLEITILNRLKYGKILDASKTYNEIGVRIKENPEFEFEAINDPANLSLDKTTSYTFIKEILATENRKRVTANAIAVVVPAGTFSTVGTVEVRVMHLMPFDQEGGAEWTENGLRRIWTPWKSINVNLT